MLNANLANRVNAFNFFHANSGVLFLSYYVDISRIRYYTNANKEVKFINTTVFKKMIPIWVPKVNKVCGLPQ